MLSLVSIVIAAIGFVLLAWGIAKIIGPGSNKGSRYSQPAERPKKTSRPWILYLVVALILSFWSGAMALFFLFIVWVILRNPARDAHFEVGKTEKSVARRVYTWLFVSSVFTVPLFIYLLLTTYSDYSSSNHLVLAALMPLLLHLPLLRGLTSNSVFVYRHTQQGIMLVAARAALAAVSVNIGSYPYQGVWLFLLGNGALWLFGSIWGWQQINRGDCWWMKQKGDLKPNLGGSMVSPNIESPRLLSPEQCLEYSKLYLKRQLKNSSKELALEAYRRGNYEIRHQAIRVLDEMNEVEFF